MNPKVRRQMRCEIVDAAERCAVRHKWHGFKARDVLPYCKKMPTVQWAIQNRYCNDDLLAIRVSQALNSSTFRGCNRFLRITQAVPGIWKEVDFCDFNDIMVAVTVRRHLSGSIDSRADKLEKAAHLMALKHLGFREAWRAA